MAENLPSILALQALRTHGFAIRMNGSECWLPITASEYLVGYKAWKAGAALKTAFPKLTREQRRFIAKQGKE